MNAHVLNTDGPQVTLQLTLDADGADLDALRVAFRGFREARGGPASPDGGQAPTRQQVLDHRAARDRVAEHLRSLGRLLLPVAEALAREEGPEADPAGFEPGRGSAHDYLPAWLVVPPLYATEKQEAPLALIKLFTPDSSWTWYVLEYDPQERLAFGLVAGHETELGYFSLAEIEQVRGPLGLRVERDLWFRPRPVIELEEYRQRWGRAGGPYAARARQGGESQPWQLTRRQYQERRAATFAGGVPVLDAADADAHGHIVRRALERGEAVPDHVLADYPGLRAGSPSPEQGGAVAGTGDAPAPGGQDGRRAQLPDGVPADIQVDEGRAAGWVTATALRVRGRWLHYRLPGGRRGKVQLAGRDIVWRPAGTAGGPVGSTGGCGDPDR